MQTYTIAAYEREYASLRGTPKHERIEWHRQRIDRLRPALEFLDAIRFWKLPDPEDVRWELEIVRGEIAELEAELQEAVRCLPPAPEQRTANQQANCTPPV